MALDANLALAGASALLFIGLLAFFGFLVRHQDKVEPKESELYGVELLRQHYEPGDTVEQPTPYFVSPIPASPDPLEISANLDKKIVLGAAMLFAVFGMLGGYLLIQPGLRAEATEHQLDIAVRRGKNLYANFCFDCHGESGQGIEGAGLPLNTAGNKYANLQGNPQQLNERELLLRRTIERGREKGPGQLSMPAWGPNDGGSLNPEQINQLLAFIEHGTDEDWHDIVTIRRNSGLAVEASPPAPPPVMSGPEGGRQLVRNNPQQACTTCHSFTAGTASTLPTAPNLSSYGTEGPLNTELRALRASGDPDWLVKWLANAPSIKAGTPMPPFSDRSGGRLSEENLRQIAEYLLTLGTGNEPR